MNKTKWAIRLVVLAAVAVAIAAAVAEARKRKVEVEAAVTDIEDQLGDLDPLTRTAVIAKLEADLVSRN
jgi:hypothetical protein